MAAKDKAVVPEARKDRGPLIQKAAGESWPTLSLSDKFYSVFSFLMLICFIIPTKILEKLGVKKKKNGRIREVRKGACWQMRFNDGQCNSTILKGRDDSLLVFGAFRPLPETLKNLPGSGKVAVLLLSDELHETFASEFVEGVTKFQGGQAPKVVCPEKARQLVSETVVVSETWEEWSQKEKDNWGLQSWRDPDATRIGTVGAFVGNFGDGSAYALQTCGIGNVPFRWDFSLLVRLVFGLRRGLFTMSRVTWVKNVPKTKAHWDEISEIQNLSLVTFFHGEPLSGTSEEIRKKMKTFQIP
uniref:Uncharacterized protein n=1 Tax=Chromera velia CCMP2878 TaxID=1169474 RepID=A0A0G4GCY7_9ALVE|eukprot:Cvel_21309.t1-p1 / transcript=Cvel_21309.t1 / gene=Cvel_21309 / organism=Chromera_velia_CCMP2878 / gene_product=hypothetical protein / transcript_product=hypothetical protein / location=Cvel_scaffold1986:22381-23547(+) / protein_length=299 / sequence_SO=supercontig / SO=protein_coding / is_pseudo=false